MGVEQAATDLLQGKITKEEFDKIYDNMFRVNLMIQCHMCRKETPRPPPVEALVDSDYRLIWLCGELCRLTYELVK